MSLPSPAEVEHADWPSLKGYAEALGLNPKGRSGIVRQRVLDHLRAHAQGSVWRAGAPEQAALLNRLGLADAAAKLWESTITLDAPAPWVGLGSAYVRGGLLDEAVKCFDRAIQMGDGSARLHKAQALMAAGKSDAALAEVEEALAVRSDDLRALAVRASIAEASGRADEALHSLFRLAQLGRGRPAYARGLMRAGRFDEAEKVLADQTARHPDDAIAWNNRGVCLGKRGMWKDALDAFRRAASLAARNPGIQNNLACALAALGKEDEALKRLGSARRLREDPRILLNEAALRERRGTPAEARAAYDRVLEIAGTHPEAAAGKRRVSPRKKRARPAPKKRARPTAKRGRKTSRKR